MQPVILGQEHGFTYGGAAGTAFALNDAVASTHADSQVKGHEMVLRSELSVGAASRSMNSKAAFVQETKLIVENMLKSFTRRLEVQLMYGQMGLGKIAAIAVDNVTLTITASEWAGGIFSGAKGCPIDIKSAVGGTLRGSVKITSVDLTDKKIVIDNSTVGASLVVGDSIFYKGADGNEFAGLHKIITNTGSLFNIDASAFELWRGNIVNVGTDFSGGEAVLSFSKIEEGITLAMEKGLADEDLTIICNPKSWKNLLTEQAAKRMFDSSFKSNGTMENGAKSIVFFGPNGKIEILPSIYCKEGYAYGLIASEFKRIGSSDVTFEQPGYEGKFFKLMEGYNGYEMRCYTDQALFTSTPGYCILYTFIKS